MKADLAADLAATKQAGYAALEVGTYKIDDFLKEHSLGDLERLFAQSGIRPVTFNSIEFIAFRGDEYPSVRSRCEQLSQIARRIGCPAIIVVPSPLPSHNTSWTEVKDEYVRVLRDLCDVAGAHGVRLALEPLGFGWCSVRTPRAAMEILDATGRKDLGMVVDCCHVFASGANLSEIDDLDPHRILAFHLDDVEDVPREAITDARRLLPGLGVVPLDEICERMRRIGYDGPCSVELFRPEYWEWDPCRTAVTSRESAIRILSRYFNLA
jgi:2-keto-myo-inositol isomerase